MAFDATIANLRAKMEDEEINGELFADVMEFLDEMEKEEVADKARKAAKENAGTNDQKGSGEADAESGEEPPAGTIHSGTGRGDPEADGTAGESGEASGGSKEDSDQLPDKG